MIESGSAKQARSKRRWLALTVGLVALSAAAVTTFVVTAHRVQAAPLVFGGTSVWAPPDNVAITAHAQVGYVRPRHDQSFLFAIHNPSSLTQTVLGVTVTNGPTPESDRVEVSTDNPWHHSGTIDTLHYVAVPVAIPPHADRVVRYTVHMNPQVCLSVGRSESMNGLDLRVRVGSSTRTDRIKFGLRAVLTTQHATC